MTQTKGLGAPIKTTIKYRVLPTSVRAPQAKILTTQGQMKRKGGEDERNRTLANEGNLHNSKKLKQGYLGEGEQQVHGTTHQWSLRGQ